MTRSTSAWISLAAAAVIGVVVGIASQHVPAFPPACDAICREWAAIIAAALGGFLTLVAGLVVYFPASRQLKALLAEQERAKITLYPTVRGDFDELSACTYRFKREIDALCQIIHDHKSGTDGDTKMNAIRDLLIAPENGAYESEKQMKDLVDALSLNLEGPVSIEILLGICNCADAIMSDWVRFRAGHGKKMEIIGRIGETSITFNQQLRDLQASIRTEINGTLARRRRLLQEANGEVGLHGVASDAAKRSATGNRSRASSQPKRAISSWRL